MGMMPSETEHPLLNDDHDYEHSRLFIDENIPRKPSAFKHCAVVSIALCVIFLLLSLVCTMVLLLSWNSLKRAREVDGTAVANTLCGPVEGEVEDGVFVFKGIPYALPPTGPGRWRAPQGLSRDDGTCWRGTRQAKRFGSMCIQFDHDENGTRVGGSEDCLFLNVWTPSLRSDLNLPVMFWIHGGYMISGSGNMPGYRPTPELTSSTNAVYVSLNYRLGPIGFLMLEELREDSTPGTSGNYGLMDVTLALHWIRDNIRHFGGNPDKVTVLGQSSGGTVIHALLASPLASGLFSRAWLASASAILNKTAEQAACENRIFLTTSRCRDAYCLRALDATEVMLATPWSMFPHWGMDDLLDLPTKGRFDGALPVVDGYVLNEAPLQAWQNGRGNDVPILITTTAQEVGLQPLHSTLPAMTWPQYRNLVTTSLSPFSPLIARTALQLYPVLPSLTPYYQYATLVSDMRVTCPMHVLANVTAHHFRSAVYHAVVTSSPSTPVILMDTVIGRHAFHVWDLLAFFGEWTVIGRQPAPSERDFQQVMRQQVMAFARDGRPLEPRWDSARVCTALLSGEVKVVQPYSQERCDFWMDNGFFSYAWIN